MSDNLFNPSEIRASYIEFMNAFDKCRKTLALEDMFFKDKLFSTVLNEICDKFFQIEHASIKCFESEIASEKALILNGTEGEQEEYIKSKLQAKDSSNDLDRFLSNLVVDFKDFEYVKKIMIVFLLVCKQIKFYQDRFENIYSENFALNDSDLIFDKLCEEIKRPSVMSKLSENAMWAEEIGSIIRYDFDYEVFVDIFGKINVFDFFQKNIRDIFDSKTMLFPDKLNINDEKIIFYCDSSFWKKCKEQLKIIDGAQKETADYEYVRFKEPFLVLLDHDGIIVSILDPNAKPSIERFEKNHI